MLNASFVKYGLLQKNTLCNCVNNLLYEIKRGSYVSAQLLLNLLNKVGKNDKMRGLPIILSFIHIEFNIFNNTGERMLVSTYNVTFNIASKLHFWREKR